MSIADDLLIAAMRVLPKKGLSRAMGALARWKAPKVMLRPLLETYVRHFNVDLDEAERPLPDYRSFDDFFTRRLLPERRPIPDDPGAVLSPCDGQVLSAGAIVAKHLVQAKGRRYSLASFLEDSSLAEAFVGGSQATFYLHPRDYHRVHSPVTGKVVGYRYVPGQLFPVNAAAVARVEDLFAINERLITVLDADIGKVAVGMVGAYGVGDISVVYERIRTNRGGRDIVRQDYERPKPMVAGEELGMFHMGSTVVVLFGPERVDLEGLKPGQTVRMGQVIGRKLAGRARLRIIPGS